jgi:hypothetical protein
MISVLSCVTGLVLCGNASADPPALDSYAFELPNPLGLAATGVTLPDCDGTRVERMLAALAEGKRRRLELTENPAVDPVDHFTHSSGSLHYAELRPGVGRAVDVYGSSRQLRAYGEWALDCFGVQGLTELFYDPLGGWADGHDLGSIGGHDDHLHIGF